MKRAAILWLTLTVNVLVSSSCIASPGGNADSADRDQSCSPFVTAAERLLGAEVTAETGDDLEAWGLVFATWPVEPGGRLELPLDAEAKIVWKVTGSGDFDIAAFGPDGSEVGPLRGPDAHGSSNWVRPGDEWGTVWMFQELGCWSFEIIRGESQLFVDFEVVEGLLEG